MFFTFSGDVPAGITVWYGRPSSRAKYASLIAVLPDDASTIGVSRRIQPLQMPYRNSDRKDESTHPSDKPRPRRDSGAAA